MRGRDKYRFYLVPLWSAVLLLALAFSPAALGSAPSQAQGSGHLVVVDGVRLSPASPRVGQQVTVTFRLRNETGRTVTIRRLVAGARGPNACALGWNGPHVDFPAVENLTLQPGQEYLYRQSRAFTDAGDYFAEPAMQDMQGRWGGLRPFPRAWFNVADASGSVPPPECLVVSGGLKLSRAVSAVGEEVEATFTLQNNSQQTVVIRRLVAAARGLGGPAQGWSAAQADFPAVADIRLAPGQTYTYRQRRTFGRPGDYFAEPAYLNADGKWGGIWPWPRVEFTVRQRDPGTVRPPSPSEYCWNIEGGIQGPAQPPTPFLYQPFEGKLSETTWTSQFDHDQPTYQRNGRVATLGESLRYDTHGPGLAGGTETGRLVNGRWMVKRFSYKDSYQSALNEGYEILAYQSPSFEAYLYYDGHDGHDFAVQGRALAAADGQVVFRETYGNTLGQVIEIYHPKQRYLTRYAHLASFDGGVQVGSQVKAGQSIGVIGGSAVVNGRLQDNYWPTHLHFSVFRWNQERGQWQITDPFGWDPWAGPDRGRRLAKQREDPLARCNGEISYPLWVGEWPQPHAREGSREAAKPFFPSQDRYVGGWVNSEMEGTTAPTPTASFSQLPIQRVFEDFNNITIGSSPAGWSQFGSDRVVPSIVDCSDGAPSNQCLYFPYVWHYSDKWLIYDEVLFDDFEAFGSLP